MSASKDDEALSGDDIGFLLECLRYTKLNFESTSYPTYELRRERLSQVDRLAEKLRRLRDADNDVSAVATSEEP